MLAVVCSAKGSPGATSLALAVTAAWSEEERAVLLEADPAGGDLAFRCRHATGGEVAVAPSLLQLATRVRAVDVCEPADPGLVAEHTQPLCCRVDLVPGLPAAAQARGLAGLWPQIAHVAAGATGDVVADLGRLDRASPTLPVAAAADAVVVVCQPRLESVLRARHLVSDVIPALPPATPPRLVVAVAVGSHRQGAADAADIDQILGATGLPVARTVPVAYDPPALAALEAGGNPAGRLARTHLMRSVGALVGLLTEFRDRPAAVHGSWEARPAR